MITVPERSGGNEPSPSWRSMAMVDSSSVSAWVTVAVSSVGTSRTSTSAQVVVTSPQADAAVPCSPTRRRWASTSVGSDAS
jgi:hypothetical protein